VTLADVNVLIYAFRPDAPNHRACRAWLESVVHGDARFGVSPLALGALVRVTTNKRAFPDPTPVAEAFAFCERLLTEANAVTVEPGARHWRIFERLCREGGVVGPPVTDAWYAALAIEHGCVFVTYDRDYARFSGLNWRAPNARAPFSPP
jgi:toxin-antitoxin system PIN domain toxin